MASNFFFFSLSVKRKILGDPSSFLIFLFSLSFAFSFFADNYNNDQRCLLLLALFPRLALRCTSAEALLRVLLLLLLLQRRRKREPS